MILLFDVYKMYNDSVRVIDLKRDKFGLVSKYDIRVPCLNGLNSQIVHQKIETYLTNKIEGRNLFRKQSMNVSSCSHS